MDTSKPLLFNHLSQRLFAYEGIVYTLELIRYTDKCIQHEDLVRAIFSLSIRGIILQQLSILSPFHHILCIHIEFQFTFH